MVRSWHDVLSVALARIRICHVGRNQEIGGILREKSLSVAFVSCWEKYTSFWYIRIRAGLNCVILGVASEADVKMRGALSLYGQPEATSRWVCECKAKIDCVLKALEYRFKS